MHHNHDEKEIGQENLLFNEINKALESDKKNLEVHVIGLNDTIKEAKHQINETKQQNKILNNIIEQKLSKSHRTHYAIILLLSLVVVSTLFVFEHYGKQPELKTGYFTYDLRGDKEIGRAHV